MKSINLLKRLASVAAGFLLGVSALSAQNITVTGTVTDALKEPIIGASVLQQGTTNGTATDIDGNFTLTVPHGAVIEISSIGFETRTLKADTEKMNVILVEDSELLNETVVVGYGVQKRESLSGAISQIRSEDIAATRTANGVDALQGKIPGLQVTQNSGKPGQFNSDLSIRGYGNPMIVVDGVVRSVTRQRKNTRSWSNNARQLESYNDISVLQELNPDDIESISVLKDASATIYGLGAQNGVILITTKKGQVKKPSVNFSTNVSFAVPQNSMVVITGESGVGKSTLLKVIAGIYPVDHGTVDVAGGADRKGDAKNVATVKVLDRYEKVLKPMHEEFIEPTKAYADIIIPQSKSSTLVI